MPSMVSIPKRGIYIDGTWKECSNRLDVINPFNEEVVGTIPAAGKADVDEAVAAASRAFKRGDWSKQSGKHRAKFLRAIADKVCQAPPVLMPSAVPICCLIKLTRSQHHRVQGMPLAQRGPCNVCIGTNAPLLSTAASRCY